jgi:formyltetrahydrofolate deformylase
MSGLPLMPLNQRIRMPGDFGYILTVRCPDQTGIVAAVSQFLADRGLTIKAADHFHDQLEGHFFMRTAFKTSSEAVPLPLLELQAGFAPIARLYKMDWAFHPASEKPRIVLAVSKSGHCLNDLLHRWKSGWLRAEIVGVVSNHEDLREEVQWHGLPYLYRLINPDTKAKAEVDFLAFMQEHEANLLVLARYMQVLTPETVAALHGRCINIHHSFLPGFKGAKPYHQAHVRGVKMIGASAHYVTADLDEGPIIEQGVERVTHSDTPDNLIEIGRDLECTVLARAVRWHCEHRVLLAGQRTVVFR